MKLYEYQAIELFKQYNIPVPSSKLAKNIHEAEEAIKQLNYPLIIKAQVQVGGRGKAGGVKKANDFTEARYLSNQILGMKIKGIQVRKVLVSEAIDIRKECYVSIVIDRKLRKPTVICSSVGGMDIEEIAKKEPEKIFKLPIDPFVGFWPYQARKLALKIFPENISLALNASSILINLYKLFVDIEACLVEINPLAVDTRNRLWAADAKIITDDNALSRHPMLQQMIEYDDEEEKKEREANAKGLSYVKLDGTIGCIVNGAGLSMATMDIIKKYGGSPANFLDIGGSSSPQKVVDAMSILLSDSNVKVVFINIFGGITRCDDVALGLVNSFKTFTINVPVVIRLSGTNEEQGKEILKQTNFIIVSSMAEGAKKAVELAQKTT